MQGIAINGTMLHEVRMLMEPYQQGAVSSLVYPKSRIRFTSEGQEIRLWFPAMLALELYRSGTLPQDAEGGIFGQHQWQEGGQLPRHRLQIPRRERES